MGYRVLADFTMTVHFLFIVFVVLGGFLAWRWPKAIWLHLAAAAWGLCIVLLDLNCPLTYVEDWARQRSGGSGLRHGFIDTYLTGVIYPERFLGEVRLLIAAVIIVSYAGATRRWRSRGSPAGPGRARRSPGERPPTRTAGSRRGRPPA